MATTLGTGSLGDFQDVYARDGVIGGFLLAAEVPTDKFSDLSDLWTTLGDFMTLCNVVKPPNFVRGLFT